MVACQSALFEQPAKNALDTPATWQHDETFLIFEPLDDAQARACAVTREPPEAQEQLPAIAARHACSSNHHVEHESIGIGEHISFAPFDPFPCVVTTVQSHRLPALEALAVDDSDARHGFCRQTCLATQRLVDALPRSCLVHVACASSSAPRQPAEGCPQGEQSEATPWAAATSGISF